MKAPLRFSRDRLDLAVNVAVLATCVLICSLAAERWIERRNAQRVGISALAPVYPAGFQLSKSSGIQLGTPTLLVGLSSQCRFCAESMPQLRQLGREWSKLSHGRGHLISVGVESDAILAAYLAKNELEGFEARTVERTSELAAIATRTPSIVLVDSTGTVLASWPGLITDDRLAEVLQRVESALAPR